jgi:2-polyprenyl-3-methyl-5-hydroxy-6-metoxy-1,4-benzoquinol methylase
MVNAIDRDPQRAELVARYRRHYSIPDDAVVTEEMVLSHWELEKSLTRKLLSSDPEERWRVFDECYSSLYGNLPWLNALVGQNRDEPSHRSHLDWLHELEPPPKKIYEIGAGRGELVRYLAEQGFICRAAEITSERGERVAGGGHDRLSWGISDGVHLAQFEPSGAYDAVLSDQLLEHLHPDDLIDHLQGSFELLRAGGSYVFRTPHRFTGPHDISRVFGQSRACGMHLKEYTFRELIDELKAIGFTRIRYVMPPRSRLILRWVGIRNKVQLERIARMYLVSLLVAERLLSIVPGHRIRFHAARMLGKTVLFRDSIFLAAIRPSR